VLRALILGMLQGGTEFLPVSSSGHLVLVPWLLGWSAPSLAFDAVLHWGTAIAVVVYFWREWVDMIHSALRSIVQRSFVDDEARLAWLIVLGAIPAAVLGYLLNDFFERLFSQPAVTAGFLLITAAFLLGSELLGRAVRRVDEINWKDALVVGFAQALAILPGISRSGSTISAGLIRGLRRDTAARYSFLLGTPVILGAGLFKLVDLVQGGDLAAQYPALLVGFFAAGAVGLGCIHFFLRYLRRRGLVPFAIYCTAAGIGCLIVAAVRGGGG